MLAGSTSIYVDLALLSEKNWYLTIPTIFRVENGILKASDVIAELDIGTSNSGINDVQVEAGLDPVFNNVVDYTETLFESKNIGLLLEDVNVEYTTVSGLSNSSANDIVDAVRFIDSRAASDNVKVAYSIASTTLHNNTNVGVEYRIYIGHVNYRNDIVVDITLADTRDFWCNTCVFSTTREVDYYNTDIELGSGRVYILNSDLYTTAGAIGSGIRHDIFSTKFCTKYYVTDIDMAHGNMGQISTDMFSTASGVTTIGSDIRLHSIYIRDFFLDVEEFTTASASAWVDLVDYVHTIDTDRTYFLVDDIRVPVVFSDIENGKRMYYDPPNDFYKKGSIVYTAHLTNDMNDVVERKYYLLFGYDVSVPSLIDWGVKEDVVVWTKAGTLSYCVNTETASYYFVTADLWARNLGATIYPVGYVDLGATLYPQNKVFYYGQTYKITISGVRDFYGNKMCTQTYTFTIEDPTSNN